MLLALLIRPFNHESYILGQKLNLVFGCVVLAIFVLAVLGWVVDRWRTRHQRGRHAALHRVRARHAGKS